MPTIKELQEQIDQLMTVVEKLGGGRFLPQQQRTQGPPPDFIEHGSAEHARFLGLIEVPEKEVDQAIEEDHYVIYKSRSTGRSFRLQDEIGLLRNYPGVDPEKAALVVLRQKIGSLESGKPKAPANAPSLWMPRGVAVR
jgi:hypothetical protein